MIKQSKFLSYVLRHHPEKANLTLDEEGWAPVSDVMVALRKQFPEFNEGDLMALVANNEKKRFGFSPDGQRIRANQGHSLEVDLALEAVKPPPFLFHGTKRQFMESIMAEGLKPGSRQHVHLSKDTETAEIVAKRRKGESVILRIATGRMADHKFYLSDNGVWLTDAVPATAIDILGDQNAS